MNTKESSEAPHQRLENEHSDIVCGQRSTQPEATKRRMYFPARTTHCCAKRDEWSLCRAIKEDSGSKRGELRAEGEHRDCYVMWDAETNHEVVISSATTLQERTPEKSTAPHVEETSRNDAQLVYSRCCGGWEFESATELVPVASQTGHMKWHTTLWIFEPLVGAR